MITDERLREVARKALSEAHAENKYLSQAGAESAALRAVAEAGAVDYVENNPPPGILIQNIDGEHAGVWLAKHDQQVRQDLMLEFFERFKATGSVSVPVIRDWWANQSNLNPKEDS